MTTESGAGIKRLKTEGLRFGGINHFPDINADLVVEHFQLVDHGNVDSTVGIFQDLRRFSDLHTGNPDDLDDCMAVHGTRQVAAVHVVSSDNLGNR